MLFISDYKLHKTLFENHPDAMMIFDSNCKVISINQRFKSLLNFSQKKLVGKEIFILFQKETQLANFHIQKALQGRTTNFDIKLVDQIGNEMLCNITFLPMINNKNVLGIHTIIKDLTEQQKTEKKLSKIQKNLHELERIANVGSWEYDINSNIAVLSEQVYSIYNIDKFDFTPSFKNLLDIVHPEDRPKVERLAKKAIKFGTKYEVEYCIEDKNGEERFILQKADVSYDECGNILRLVGTVQDITSSKKLIKELNERDGHLRIISNNLGVGMWSFDVLSNRLTFCSMGVENIYGIKPRQLYKNPNIWKEFIHPDDIDSIEKDHLNLQKGTEMRHQYRIIVGKKTKWVDDHKIPTLNESGELIRVEGLVVDVTEQKHLQTTIEYIDNHDKLTNLPNRQLFEEKLANVIKFSKSDQIRFAVMSLDIDRFKYINDSLGHVVGDKLIKSISSRINKIIGPDSLLARSDGDEFLILIKDFSQVDEYIRTAIEIREEIENLFFIDEYELFITTSIGVSFYPFDGENATDIIKSADIALRQAKEAGKNNCQIFSPSMDVESFKIYSLEKDLRLALINEQFIIEYQPKVEINTGKIVGVEALIRWEHPEWGKVSPLEFIPLAEETGLIVKIDEWVLRKVCSQINKWKQRGVPLVPISVNFSPKMLVKTNIVENIKGILEETEVSPSLIEFEITERTLIKHKEKVQSVLKELRDIGIKIGLDDFGTGYSSLSYLKDLHVDLLKIDKSFIDEINNDKSTEAIIKSIIYLARELNVKVVAEGVETPEQLLFLSQRECQIVQGYIYSKSVSDKKFEKTLCRGYLKPNNNVRSNNIIENRRNYYRINLQFPLCSGMTIISFKGKKVSLGRSKALIEDISIGGLRFTTNIEFPVQPDIIFEFKIKIMNEVIKTTGVIVWKLEIGDNLYQYGLEFNIGELERDHLSQTLNTFMLKLKNDPLLGGCDFHLESKHSYFMS